MRTRTLGIAAMLPLLVAGFTMAAGTTIVGTRHDFSKASWSDGEICKPCHTPHNAAGNEISGRLWNHEMSKASYTLNGHGAETEPGGQADMDKVSRLCLSCHDGTVALDSFGGASGSEFIGPRGDVGTDLSNDHPVGLHAEYPTENNSAAGQYAGSRYKPTYTLGTDGKPLQDANGAYIVDLAGPGKAGISFATDTTKPGKLFIGCRSCHDVHGAKQPEKLLRIDNSGSKLCLACHNK